jgi:hypothetical protein
MINVSTITTALYTVLSSAAGLSVYEIERGQRINYEPGRCPWIGVYPDKVSTEPLSIGAGSSRWMSRGAAQVVVQTSSFVDDGQAASDQLETVASEVCAAVASNLTLGILGLRIVGVSRDYRYVVFDDDGAGSVFMPQVVLRFEFEQRSY